MYLPYRFQIAVKCNTVILSQETADGKDKTNPNRHFVAIRKILLVLINLLDYTLSLFNMYGVQNAHIHTYYTFNNISILVHVIRLE